jgi:predicted metal-binding membrane protein
MGGDAPILRLLRRDRAVVAAALGGAVLLAWAYLLLAARDMPSASAAVMMAMPWTAATFATMAVIWLAMMAAMMLPSAAPMILLFATIERKGRPAPGRSRGATSLFAGGYLAVWAGFAIVATAAQWGLDEARLLSPSVALASGFLAGGVLLLAGIYQLTPLKQACLRLCRSPFDFLMRYRQGRAGALAMGLRHGMFCLGCCWAIMALLFVGGAMNMGWVAALTLFVLAEKQFPAGRLVGRAGGIGLILWGGATLFAAAA